jgi:hypothetical protein
VKFFARFAGWATLLFVVAWFASAPYQRAIAAAASAIAAPGTEVEWIDLQLFHPHDLAVFVALCAASTWVGWRERGRAIALGLPLMIAAEIVSLVIAMKALISAMTGGHPPAHVDEVQRFALGTIRVTGLITAACVWAWLLGREVLGLAAAAGTQALARHSRRNP